MSTLPFIGTQPTPVLSRIPKALSCLKWQPIAEMTEDHVGFKVICVTPVPNSMRTLKWNKHWKYEVSMFIVRKEEGELVCYTFDSIEPWPTELCDIDYFTVVN